MRPLLLLAALAATQTARAADHELSFEAGTLVLPDASFETFSDSSAAFGMGLRAAYAFHEHFAVQAGWHHVRTGASLLGPASETLGHGAYFGNEALVGVRFDWPIRDLFVPYAHLDGLLWFSDARFDYHTSDPDSPEQRRESAISGGGRAMGGVELRIPRKTTQGFTGAIHLEAGYSLLGAAQFDTFGTMPLSGFTLRGGIGLRY